MLILKLNNLLAVKGGFAIFVFMKKYLYLLALTLVFLSCKKDNSAVLASFAVYCEMVANEAKPIAFHYPMPPAAIDGLWANFEEIAQKYQVQLHREDDFPETLLFDAKTTQGQTVVIIYKNHRLTQYQQWKQDLLASAGGNTATQTALARRLGRLLGYSPQGINQLLAANSAFKTLQNFGVRLQTTHLYVADVPKALQFYGETLGLPKVNAHTFMVGETGHIAIHPYNDAHPKGQPKSTAIALLTDQLPQWYAHLQAQKVAIKYPLKSKAGGPHDGFVAIDPEGYLLEFEQFKQHPENESFMAVLSKTEKIATAHSGLFFYGTISWTYHKDLLKMQSFYEDTLGFRMVADQGWTKIYQTSPAAFIGLVDECRGMMDYAPNKAVELEWGVNNLKQFKDYAKDQWPNYKNSSLICPENYKYQIKEARDKN